MTEQELQRAIIEFLTWHGWLVLRVNSGVMVKQEDLGGGIRRDRRVVHFVRWHATGVPAGAQTKGVADIIALTPAGQFAALEVKLPGRKPTAAQRRFLEEVAQRGGVAAVVSSLEDVEGILNA